MLSLTSPTTIVSVLVPVFEGVPESFITIGNKYSFCCSLSKEDSDETIATPSPFAPSCGDSLSER